MRLLGRRRRRRRKRKGGGGRRRKEGATSGQHDSSQNLRLLFYTELCHTK
jgi:hypothetical protein